MSVGYKNRMAYDMILINGLVVACQMKFDASAPILRRRLSRVELGQRLQVLEETLLDILYIWRFYRLGAQVCAMDLDLVIITVRRAK